MVMKSKRKTKRNQRNYLDNTIEIKKNKKKSIKEMKMLPRVVMVCA
jgi:hypothetical protein